MKKITLIINSKNNFSIEENRIFTDNNTMFSFSRCNEHFIINDCSKTERTGPTIFGYDNVLHENSAFCNIVENMIDFNVFDVHKTPILANSIKFPDVKLKNIINLNGANIQILENGLI